MEPTLRSAQVLRQEAVELEYEDKEIAVYVNQQQALDREDRVAWRNLQMAELQVEDKKRADEIQAEKEKRVDDIKIQMAKIEADKELTLNEMELQAQAQAQASTSPL